MDHNRLNDKLPLALYSAQQVRRLDAIAIERLGVPGFTLMRRAGHAAFHALLNAYPEVQAVTVFCGTGNNGGDGYVIATLARHRGIAVSVIQVGDGAKVGGDALQARQQAQQDDIEFLPFDPSLQIESGVIVDALLGTGFNGVVRGPALAAIEWINRSKLPVVAVDVPSGVCSDTGAVSNSAVYADHTVSFIGIKQGVLTGDAVDYTGYIHFSNLDVPDEVYAEVTSSVERLDLNVQLNALPPRRRSAHKGLFGHVMVTGGDSGMAGAAAMASLAASRIGAGLTSCATRPQHISAIISLCPETMVHGVISGQELEPLLTRASVIVVGPGLGRGPWGEQLLQKVLACNTPMVVDADALNLLAERPLMKRQRRENWVLTPHPGEASRLLNCSIAEIQSDRFAAVQAMQDQYGGAVVLKGAGTLVAVGVADGDSAKIGLSCYGNPGMASGGMGDVLSGVIGGLLAQGLSVAEAARLAVCVHGAAAQRAAVDGERGMLATDLLPHLRAIVQ